MTARIMPSRMAVLYKLLFEVFDRLLQRFLSWDTVNPGVQKRESLLQPDAGLAADAAIDLAQIRQEVLVNHACGFHLVVPRCCAGRRQTAEGYDI
jgi:hypothetical protein